MNKHQRLAMLIAPFLAIGGYVAADYYAAAQAKAAMDSRAGRLTTVDGCHLLANNCTLQKGSLTLKLTINPADSKQLLLSSNQTLQSVSLALSDDSPARMLPDENHQHWKIDLASPIKAKTTLKLVTSINDVFYFVEISDGITE